MAGQISGTDPIVALYDENVTYGVPPLTPFNGRKLYCKLPLNSKAVRAKIDNPILRGGRGTLAPGLGNWDVGVQIDTVVAPESIGFFLKHLLGTPVTTGAATPWTHTFRPKALPIGFDLEIDWTGKVASKVEQFTGLRMASGSFEFNQEGYHSASFTAIGKGYNIITAALDSTLDDLGHTGFMGFNGVIKKGGTQIGGITKFSLAVDNTMPGGPYCFPGTGETAGQRRSNPEGRANISGSMELVFEDFTLLDLARAQTDTTFEVLLTFGTAAGTAGNESLSFLLDHSILTPKSAPLDTESGLLLPMDFQAFASGATDMGLVVVLKNTQSGTVI